MKSQSLPITTVALIIIAILALVVVTVFFISGFGDSGETTEDVIGIGEDKVDDAEDIEILNENTFIFENKEKIRYRNIFNC